MGGKSLPKARSDTTPTDHLLISLAALWDRTTLMKKKILLLNVFNYCTIAISSTNRLISRLISSFNLAYSFFAASPHPNHVGRACLKLKVYVRPPGKSRSNYTHTHTRTHTHRSRLAIKGKLGGNKRSDRMPRQQHSLLWFTDRPGNTLTPLHTLDTHTFWRIHTDWVGGRRVHAHRHKVAYALHIKSHHITTGVRETFCPCRKENREAESAHLKKKSNRAVYITPPARCAPKKQESNLIINPSHTVEL